MPKDKLYEVLRDIETDLSLMWMDERLDRSMQEANLSMALDQQWAQNYLTADLAYQVDDLKERVAQQSRLIADLMKTSKVSPLEAEVQTWKKRALKNEELGLYPEALEAMKHAEEKDPHEFRLQSWLGRMYLRHMNDPTSALTHYQKAVRYATPRSTPDAARNLLGVAHCKEAMGDLAGAYEASKEAAGLDASHAPTLYEHSAHCAQMEQRDAALKHLEQAIRQSPIYWDAAQGDERFEPLGETIASLLDSLLRESTLVLESLLALESRLSRVLATWQVNAESLSPDEYAGMRRALQEAAEALEGGSYKDRVAAAKEGAPVLRRLIQSLNDQLAKRMVAAEGAIDGAADTIKRERSQTRRARLKAVVPYSKLIVLGVGGLGLFLVSAVVMVHEIVLGSVWWSKLLGAVIPLPFMGAALWMLFKAWEALEVVQHYRRVRRNSRETTHEARQEMTEAQALLPVLRKQHASIQSLVQELAQ